MSKYSDIGIEIPFGRTSGRVKTKCPRCSGQRHNKTDKALSVNLDEGLYKCHYCGWSGSVNEKKELYNHSYMPKEYKKPKWNNKTDLSDKMVEWFEGRGISQPTIKALQITEGLEYMPQKSKECNTVQFNYFLNSELINVKYRTGDKCFKLVSGAELILWNIDSLTGQKDAIITEGEIDALSYLECGFKSVVSVPNGANGTEYLDNYIELFDDKETIYIAADTDRKGVILRDELVRRFGPEKCRIVTYGPECKDANEHLIKYGKESLRITISNAEDIKIEGVFTLSDIRQQVDLLFQKGLSKGLTIGHYGFDRLISFETGRLCIVTGIPSHGKSEFVDEITTLLNTRYGLKFAYFSPENHPLPYLVSKLASKITGKPFDKEKLKPSEFEQVCAHIENNYFFINPEENFTIDTILEKASYLVKKSGIKGLVIDPYNAVEHQIPPGMNETNYISKLLGQLTDFARKKDVLVFLVAHPRKMNKNTSGVVESPNLYDINGSANFFNKADFGLTVYRDRVNDLVRIEVHKVKFKHLGHNGNINFKYNLDNGRYVEYHDETTIQWNNKSYLLPQNTQSDIAFSETTPPESKEDFFTTLENKDLPF